jgi:hypothetical protein
LLQEAAESLLAVCEYLICDIIAHEIVIQLDDVLVVDFFEHFDFVFELLADPVDRLQ